MSYKVINNTLNAEYGVDTITSFFNFKKVIFSDITLFKKQEEKVIDEKKKLDNINDQIIQSSVNGVSIDELIGEVPRDLSSKIADISKKSAAFNKKVDEDDKVKKIVQIEKIVISRKSAIEDQYKKTVYDFFKENSNAAVFKDQLDALYAYINKKDVDRYDVGCIARSINKIFSVYFQSLFDEIQKIVKNIGVDSIEGYIKKLQSNKKLEIYEMFRFVNWTYERGYKNIISDIKNQDNKEKFNILKSFLEFEAKSESFKNSYFYVGILDHLKSLRDFHAHEDDGNIEKLAKKLSPEKIKEKLYNKFLGNLLEDGNGFLQIIISKQLDAGEVLQAGEE